MQIEDCQDRVVTAKISNYNMVCTITGILHIFKFSFENFASVENENGAVSFSLDAARKMTITDDNIVICCFV